MLSDACSFSPLALGIPLGHLEGWWSQRRAPFTFYRRCRWNADTVDAWQSRDITSNKKLLVTSASLLVTSALLLVTRSY